MIARILRRRISYEDYKRLFRIKGQQTTALLSLPNTTYGHGAKKAASATSKAGAAAMKPFRWMKEGGKSEAKRLNMGAQDTSGKRLIYMSFFDIFCALLCFPQEMELAPEVVSGARVSSATGPSKYENSEE